MNALGVPAAPLRSARAPRSGIRTGLALEDGLARALGLAVLIVLLVLLAWPLASILIKAFQDESGHYAGLARIGHYLGDADLRAAGANSLWLALGTTALVLPAAFLFAFALTRCRLWGRGLLRWIAFAPLLAPSLMPAISLVYLFGNQGLLRSWMLGHSIYGPIGIVMGEVFYTFPHAVMVLVTALSVADARLYEAAATLGAGRLRRLLTITLPNARQGLVSAALLVFTLVVTDFGVPKVIGGQTNVLALEVYKQVIGQQNFAKGAVIGLLLVLPALLSVFVQRRAAAHEGSVVSGRFVPLRAPRNDLRDALVWLACALVAAFLLALLGTAMAASLMRLWPYQPDFTLAHFDFDNVDGGGWGAFYNSLKLASATAVLGTVLVFLGAYSAGKLRIGPAVAAAIGVLAMLPMAVPGLVLGLGYIFCFNAPGNPLQAAYGSLGLMAAATVVHFYTTAHVSVATALRQLDGEIEAASRCLGRPWWTSCRLVTLPLCLPALLDAARYYFVSSLTTVSAVVFLYTPDTLPASVAVLAMDDAGDTAAAAAMASLIVLSAIAASLLLNALSRWLERRYQTWRAA